MVRNLQSQARRLLSGQAEDLSKAVKGPPHPVVQPNALYMGSSEFPWLLHDANEPGVWGVSQFSCQFKVLVTIK